MFIILFNDEFWEFVFLIVLILGYVDIDVLFCREGVFLLGEIVRFLLYLKF